MASICCCCGSRRNRLSARRTGRNVGFHGILRRFSAHLQIEHASSSAPCSVACGSPHRPPRDENRLIENAFARGRIWRGLSILLSSDTLRIREIFLKAQAWTSALRTDLCGRLRDSLYRRDWRSERVLLLYRVMSCDTRCKRPLDAHR